MIFLFKYCADMVIVKVSVFSVICICIYIYIYISMMMNFFKFYCFDSLVFSLNNSFSIKKKMHETHLQISITKCV